MSKATKLPAFDHPRLAHEIEGLATQAIDALPFGVIRLDPQGKVVYYSEAERRLSGSGQRERLGLDLFAQIAPCMDNPDYRGRIERARAAGTLDLEFFHIGDFEDRERELSVRVQSALDGGCWIFMRRC